MESSPLTPVNPVKPIAPYLGGKRILSKPIIAKINATPHSLYVEPFFGMGGLFFRRDMRPSVEVINDISRDVVTTLRVLQWHYQAFLDCIKWQLSSRAEFDLLMKVDPDTLTDLRRAARFLYLQRLSFGGQVDRRTFGLTRTNPSRFDLTKLVPMLEAAHDRLTSVTIECLPYDRLITRYDCAGALFYLDPPYWNCEDDYGPEVFSRDDFCRLRDLLEAIKGRFILSINDNPEVREMFKMFTMEPVEINYRVSGKVTPAKELVISNG
jgi:DNA adenine methylase